LWFCEGFECCVHELNLSLFHARWCLGYKLFPSLSPNSSPSYKFVRMILQCTGGGIVSHSVALNQRLSFCCLIQSPTQPNRISWISWYPSLSTVSPSLFRRMHIPLQSCVVSSCINTSLCFAKSSASRLYSRPCASASTKRCAPLLCAK